MPELQMHDYQLGDLAAIPCVEDDPMPGWAEAVEQSAGGMASIYRGGKLIAVIGFTLATPGVADSFAVVDREGSRGAGRELAAMTAGQVAAWMRRASLHRAAATCKPSDKASAAFLRAIGYRRECLLEAAAPDGSDLMQFKLIRR